MEPETYHDLLFKHGHVKLTELPMEILIRIFELLDLKDRKAGRLTCRYLWYACNSFVFTNKEKFFLHRLNITNNKHTLKCRIIRKNLEFHGLDLQFIKFPKIVCCHGPQLRSLFFLNCDIDGFTFKSIVIHCPNLTSLNFRHLYKGSWGYQGIIEFEYAKFLAEDVLDELLARKIEQRKLVSFKVYGYKVDSTRINRIWEKIFRIYPCIHTFGEELLDSKSFPISYYYRRELDDLEKDYPFGDWVFPPNIKNLSSNRRMTASWKMPELKFKKLSIVQSVSIVRHGHRSQNDVLEFFSHQTELEVLKLHMWHDYEMRENHFAVDDSLISMGFLELLDILRNSPKLKDVEILIKHEISFTMTQFCCFLEWINRLESLKLINTDIFLPNNFDILNARTFFPLLSPDKFTNLKKLCLILEPDYTVMERTEFAFQILHRCCAESLEHLELCGFKLTRAIRQKITTLGALRKLVVDMGSWTRNTTRTINLANLRHLQYLLIENILPETLEMSLPKLFPINLTYLRISVMWCTLVEKRVWVKTLDVISKNLPRIEILKIDHDPGDCPWYHVEDLPMACKRLTRLQFLRIWWFRKLVQNIGFNSEEALTKLFTECPSLRLVDSSDNSDDDCPYTYDRSSGQLVRLSAQDRANLWRTVKLEVIEQINHYDFFPSPPPETS